MWQHKATMPKKPADAFTMPKQPSMIQPDSYEVFFSDLKKRISTARVKAALAVNKELILLYWQIGTQILAKQAEEGWGSKIIEKLSKDLKRTFPDMKGFSPRNLKYMRALAEAYPDQSIVLQAIAQIPWGHNQSLLNKLDSLEERVWYARKTVESGWSRNILEIQIETGLYRRQGLAVTNFERMLPKPQSDLAQQMLKDPYSLEFLTVSEDVAERELEQALVTHIREFLLELGVGFSFVGSQVRLEVEGDEFFMDMLFYHLKLRCYVVIELKTTDFKPEYAGKMNFYVSAVDDLMRHPDDKPTIGIVLCKSSKKTIAEYALRNVSTPIAVSTHKLPKKLQNSLPTPEQLEMEIEAAVQSIEARSRKPTKNAEADD
ncbi:MAG: hypothetical protein HLUCCA11_22685 [Phormidesmis priestleyi Ana]|uniref:DUF1016 domain-containing protein n=1 Tax=Phormidesmis priestleyi Ana TaxID=1666911 RepID=A0A0P7ZQB9_9CYAN|nr:MAG: hypothetical protein HLUCCA11_22685 [Phormidesmis priestleyi Ana]